jgi:hypothetical protein
LRTLSVKHAVLVLAALTTWLGSARGEEHPAGASVPEAVVDLRTLGWVPPPHVSDREFFKDMSLGKLEALDENTRILFLTEDVIVVYHTKQEGRDWRTSPRFLEAFFIQAKDGGLLSIETWPVSPRKAYDDRRDSEARLIPSTMGASR